MASYNAAKVRQSHDPHRKLSSRVVQARSKAQSQLHMKLGKAAPQSREQAYSQLREAVERTASVE